MHQSPWKTLTEHNVLNEVEKTIGQELTGLYLPRNSYINRVYELELKESKERIIVKFYRPDRWTKEQIVEEHNFINKLNETEIPVIPPLTFNNQSVFNYKNILFSIFPKKGGRAIDEFDKDLWSEVGRLIGRMHLISQAIKKPQRMIWQPAQATKKHLEILHQTNCILPDFRDSLFNASELFIKKADPLFSSHELFLIHGDCHMGNFIYRPGEGIYIIDFDDISVGPAIQDLWMLLPDKPEKCKKELHWFIQGYETFREFPEKSLKLIPALRGMRIIHFLAWCAIQSEEPSFSNHFPEFKTPKYWNETIKEIQALNFDPGLYPHSSHT